MFNLNPSSFIVAHTGVSQRGPSPELWRKANSQMYSPDGTLGSMLSDDFKAFGLTTAVASNVGRYASGGNVYLSYEDTGNSITQIATNPDGAIKITTDTTDNDESWIQPGGAASVSTVVSTTAGVSQLVVFECRVKASSVADSTINWFAGLSEEGLAAANTITDAGALADKDFLGFWVLEGDGDSIKFGYRKEGQAVQTVGSNDLSADTYARLGFIYDPNESAAKKIRWYVNGVEKSTYVTATDLAAATFPNGQELQPLFGVKNGTTTALDFHVDWFASYYGG